MSQMLKRDRYLTQLIDRQWNGQIKVITGLRRCGKSFLLKIIFRQYLNEHGVKEEDIISLDLDNDVNYFLCNPLELGKFIREKTSDPSRRFYIFLDEIQNCEPVKNPALPDGRPITVFKTLNGLATQGNLDIYVTGSNSLLLSSEMSTEFRGRSDSVRLHPLGFSEFLPSYSGDRREALEEYLRFGGMPYLVGLSKESDKEEYLRQLYKETYIKDIIERWRIERLDVLEGILDLLCSSIGSLTNPSRITRALEAAGKRTCQNTVQEYIWHLRDSFLFSEFRRYDIKGRTYLDYPNKYYCEDIGLRNARLGFRQQEKTHLLENLICNELTARGFSTDIGTIESYEKDANGKSARRMREIDFIVQKSDEKVYIQSAFAIADEEKRFQETRPFQLTNDFFRKILVRGDVGRRWFDEEGILNINYLDFLLDEQLI